MKSIFLIILLIFLIIPLVTADNITVITPNPTVITTYPTMPLVTNPTQVPTGYVPTPTMVPTSTPTPVTIPTHYIYQGESVYINDTIDISGVVPPYPELAYWNGYDMYDSNASYIITLPVYKSGYYHFYLDPTIFSTRTGNWYKYDGTFEPNANNIAFVVYPQSMKNSTMRYANGTLVNISEMILNNYTDMEIPIRPPVEIKHISDYLVARGDSFSIKTNATTNIWLFGRIDELFDFKSTNATEIDLSKDVLSGFETGDYTIMMQTIGNTSNNFTVKYDDSTHEIKWFDPTSFSIDKININGWSPQVVLEQFQKILPETLDTFKTYKLELQDPSIEIQSISETHTPNYTIDEAGITEYNTNLSYIEVKGYTNVAIGSTLKFIVDEKQQTPKTLFSHTTTTVSGGTKDPGDMRWFDVMIPVDKYNLATGEHTVSAYTNISDTGTIYTFTIYMAPAGSYVPPKTIRYISGQYGPEEFVPTPTPIVQTVTVTIPGPTQTIIVTVTPSDEQVKAQQKIISDENIKTWGTRIIIIGIVMGIIWYLISLYLRRKELGD
jgi:hypothetical protein